MAGERERLIGAANTTISANPPNGHAQEERLELGSEGLRLCWSDISVITKEKKRRKVFLSEKLPGKQILKNVSGLALPGELLAIMGSSGAGKSTLLNTLLFRNTGSIKESGRRMVGGRLMSPASMTSLSGFVQQDDLFLGTLTVREHLSFHAMVRMERGMTISRRMERVEEVLLQLGLAQVGGTVIGKPGQIKGISGGEAKRLSLASEILTNPPLLFCDEPTSGLDSYMANSVIDLLRDLARQGRTVVFTIHQPSSQIFCKFDRLLLLVEGRTAYLGPAGQEAVQFFNRCGFPCPVNYNPAEHFLDILSKQEENHSGGGEFQKTSQLICTAYENSAEGKELMAAVRHEEENLKPALEGTQKLSPYKAGWGLQFRALLWRNWLALLKEPKLMQVKLLQTMAVALLYGVLFYGQQLNQAGIMNLNGAIFVAIVINLTFGNLFPVLTVFCGELPLFLREHYNGMYRVDTYFLTKQLVAIPLFLVQPTLFLVIFYFMVGLQQTALKFFSALAIVILMVQDVIGLGYAISCAFGDLDLSLAVAPVIHIPLLVFGGFYLNSGSVPVWLVWIKYISFFYYSFNVLMINQWADIEEISCAPDGSASTESSGGLGYYAVWLALAAGNSNATEGGSGVMPCISSGQQVLEQFNIRQEDFWMNIIGMGILAVALRLVAFVCLLIRSHRRST